MAGLYAGPRSAIGRYGFAVTMIALAVVREGKVMQVNVEAGVAG